VEPTTEALQSVLDFPLVRRIRRNHGLEHATIHVLSQKLSSLTVVGRSDGRGFSLIGDAPSDLISEAVQEALDRMRRGEHDLAVHPNCGTNIVAVAALGALTTLVALIGSERERRGKLVRLPLVMTGLMGAMIVGQPLGLSLQKHITTLGDPGDLQILSITRSMRGGVTVHRIETNST
jgi:hypothetical protein